MKLSFVIYSYFPYGGQQRDFMRILNECLSRGHQVDVYTLRWEGEVPAGVTVHRAAVSAFTRTSLYKKFSRWLDAKLAQSATSYVVGFNKMPGLSIYYAADPCFLEMAQEQRPAYYRYTPRYKHFSGYEAAVLGEESNTEVLYLSAQQYSAFTKYYPTSKNRLHALPPGLAEDRKLDDRSSEGRRQRKLIARRSLNAEFQIAEDATLILQIGSGFKVKGVDRALKAIAALPKEMRDSSHYLLVGSDKPRVYLALAKRLGIAERVTIAGGRDDVPSLLAAADLMLHPAYRESAGYTLLEAIVAGLPVLATATCGYACHIKQADAGVVCDEPITQTSINEALDMTLRALPTSSWSENGLAYGADENLFRMPQVAVDFIEQFTKN